MVVAAGAIEVGIALERCWSLTSRFKDSFDVFVHEGRLTHRWLIVLMRWSFAWRIDSEASVAYLPENWH